MLPIQTVIFEPLHQHQENGIDPIAVGNEDKMFIRSFFYLLHLFKMIHETSLSNSVENETAYYGVQDGRQDTR